MTRMMLVSFLLWLISKKPRHGYDLIHILQKEVCYLKVGAGHIYPVLAELSFHGLIKARASAQGKRIKKLYSITPVGRRLLAGIRKRFFHGGMRAQFFKEMVS